MLCVAEPNDEPSDERSNDSVSESLLLESGHTSNELLLFQSASCKFATLAIIVSVFSFKYLRTWLVLASYNSTQETNTEYAQQEGLTNKDNVRDEYIRS